MKDLKVLESVEWDEDQDLELDRGDILSRSPPFKFRGGWVGYLGYEFRHDTRLSICDQEICKVPLDNYSGARFEGDSVHVHHTTKPNVPTAAFIFADRSLVYDHWRDDWYVVAVTLNDDANASRESEMSSREWIRNTCKHLQSLKGHQSNAQIHGSAQLLVHQFNDIYKNQSNFQLLRSKHQYEVDIARCLQEIKNGESYELCLTNKLNTKVVSNVGDTKTPFGLYKILRRINPAPYSAFLNFGCNPSTAEESNSAYGSLAICCSSPELFLSVSKLADDTTSSKPQSFFTVESKPIKGTAPRKFVDSNAEPDIQSLLESEQLRRSIKNRAENLMIVDLLRNDFSRVCEPGSVHVPKLMQIESYATVHQMVSTIRGIIDSNKVNAMDVISACFPGGSMTGAPKLRSVDILDDIEEGVSRGPYSGCLGYMSLDGCMDMNIVIRTAILTPYVNTTSGNNDGWDVSIGAGGAITALSESDSEYDEMLLKARALLAAVNIWDNKS
jgi:para-aminobenzoate synthetase